MNNKQLALEHSKLMYYSQEIIQLKIPKEVNYIFYSVVSIIAITIISLFTIKINDVVKVHGIVRTKDNNVEIKNIRPGTITSINYKMNEYINEGDTLFTIDDNSYEANMSILNTEYDNTVKELECVDALIDGINTNINNYKNDAYINSKIEDYLKTIKYLNREIEINKYQYDFERKLPESMKNQKTEKESYLRYKLSLEELEKYKANTMANLQDRKKALLINKNKIEQEIYTLKKDYSFLDIKAPISGYIQEITPLNIGDYVFSSQRILKIIPTDSKAFRVQLSIPTKDIGEIKEGMEVKYRLSAFPFFEYKGAEGEIQSIDPDIRQNEKNELVYTVYSNINKTSFSNYEGDEYPLRSGIEVDARIVLNKTRLVSYIFKKMGYIK